MAMPIKTGRWAWLVEYGCWVKTDHYQLEGHLILRTAPQRTYDDVNPTEAFVSVKRIHAWFDGDKDGAHGTLIAKAGDWVLVELRPRV